MTSAGAPAGVLFVHSSAGRYGADRQLHLIAAGLDQARYRPVALLPEEGPLAGDLRAGGVEVIVRPLSVLRRELVSVGGFASVAAAAARDAVALARLIRRRRLALVHSNTSVVLSGAVGAAAARVPHVWHVREIYSRFGTAWPAYRRVLASARALPCVSAATAAQFPGWPRVRVLHDGLAIDPRRTERSSARRILVLPPEAPVLAVIGRISDWKGQDVLVRALGEPPLRDRGTIALIAGEAWPGAQSRAASVAELAARLGVSERVRVVGFRDDVETVLGAADVVVVPSTAPDPLPGSAIEAASAGCAVIASDTGGLPEIIRDRRTGLLVPPGDPAALAGAAAELLDDLALRERLGRAAAEDVRDRFSAERLLDGVTALYEEVLGAKG